MARPQNKDQQLVLDIVSSLDRRSVNPTGIATDLSVVDSETQKIVYEIVSGLIGIWAEWDEQVHPDHPLAEVYHNARLMRDGLFAKNFAPPLDSPGQWE